MNSLLYNVQTMQDLFTQVNISDIFCNFLINLKIFTVIHFLSLMSVGWDVKWWPVSRITTPWHAKDRFTGFR